MTTKLEVLRDLSTSLGFACQIEQVPAEYDCPVHELPLLEHHLETISGWQAVMVCPGYDGSCRYDPDSDPIPIEPPEGKRSTGEPDTAASATTTPTKPAKPANQGGF